MRIVSMGVFLGGNGPVIRVAEGCVRHENDGLVGGGTVPCHRNNLLCHLIHIDLERGGGDRGRGGEVSGRKPTAYEEKEMNED